MLRIESGPATHESARIIWKDKSKNSESIKQNPICWEAKSIASEMYSDTTDSTCMFPSGNGFAIFDRLRLSPGAEVDAGKAAESRAINFFSDIPKTLTKDKAKELIDLFLYKTDYWLSQQEGQPLTTASIALLYTDEATKETYLTVNSIGNSPIYLYRDNQLVELTTNAKNYNNKEFFSEGKADTDKIREHQLLMGNLTDINNLDSKYLESWFTRHKTHHLGDKEHFPQPKISLTMKILDGDWIIGFSNGIPDVLTNNKIKALLEKHKHPREAAEALISEAIAANKSPSNIRANIDDKSVGIMQFGGKEAVYQDLRPTSEEENDKLSPYNIKKALMQETRLTRKNGDLEWDNLQEVKVLVGRKLQVGWYIRGISDDGEMVEIANHKKFKGKSFFRPLATLKAWNEYSSHET